MTSDVRFDVSLVALPTRDALATSIDRSPSAQRELVFIKATDNEGRVGWGECSALNTRGYTHEWARGAFGMLTSGYPISSANHPMAFAGLEMAQLDLRLRAETTSLAAHLGVTRSTVAAGATVGLGPVDDTVANVSALVDAGYGRVKLKIGPGDILDRTSAVRSRFDQLAIQVDANGSLGSSDLDELAQLGEIGVDAIEQPFPVNAKDLTLQLRELLGITIMADEAIRTAAELDQRSFYGGLVVKPGPIGGFTATQQLVDRATELGWVLSVGGMLESGLGRHGLAAVAAGDSFNLTGDLSPARRWLLHDPWPDLQMVEGNIVVPTEPGVASLPDVELLERFTVARGQSLRH